MPWLGLTIGAIAGAIAGSLTDYEISDDFIKKSAKLLNQAILLVSPNRKID